MALQSDYTIAVGPHKFMKPLANLKSVAIVARGCAILADLIVLAVTMHKTARMFRASLSSNAGFTSILLYNGAIQFM